MSEARGRHGLAWRLGVWLAGSALGVLLVALPDDGDRVVSLSEGHGPSLVDLVGVVVLVGAWLPLVAELWAGRRALAPGERVAVAATLVAGAVVVTAGVAFDLGASWVAGVVLLVAAQLAVIYRAWRDRRGGRPAWREADAGADA